MILDNTDHIIAKGMSRDTALDLLEFFLRYNNGVHWWTIATDYCEEEWNKEEEEKE